MACQLLWCLIIHFHYHLSIIVLKATKLCSVHEMYLKLVHFYVTNYVIYGLRISQIIPSKNSRPGHNKDQT